MQKRLVVAIAAALSVAGLTAAPSISTAERQIVVQPGESMRSISRRVYGDEDYVWAITRFNHLASPDLIYAGLVLALPDSTAIGAHESTADRTDDERATANYARFDAAATAAADPAVPPLPLPILSGPASPDSPTSSTVAPASTPVPQAPATVDELVMPGPVIQTGLATWYGPGFNGNLTFCGDEYDESAYTAASNTLPCGMIVIVTNQNTGASVRVRVTDRGGFGGSVIMDLSRAAFGAIASYTSGVVPVTISQIGP